MPIDLLGEFSRDDRPEQRAEVDPHVEDREPRVAPLVPLCVQRADDGGDVGLEQPRSDDDERQAGVEERQRVEGEREVAQRDDDPAHEHAAVLTQPPVGDHAAEDRRQPDAADVVAEYGARVRVGEAERLRHVQDQKPAHPVVAEALPHLGEEERGEAPRVAEPVGAPRRLSRRAHSAPPPRERPARARHRPGAAPTSRGRSDARAAARGAARAGTRGTPSAAR